MKKYLLKLYFLYFASLVFKTFLLTTAAIVVGIAFSPLLPQKVILLVLSVLLSFYITEKFLLLFIPRRFLWRIEKDNPWLNERLVSYYELKKEDNIFVQRLEKELKDLLIQKKLRMRISFQREFRILYFSIIILFLSLLINVKYFSGWHNKYKFPLDPNYACIFADDSTFIKQPFHEKTTFLIHCKKPEVQILSIRDTVLKIKNFKPGRYYIKASVSKLKSTISIVDILPVPRVDSIKVKLGNKIYKNEKSLLIKRGEEFKLDVYVCGDFKSILFFNSEVIATGTGHLSYNGNATKDFTVDILFQSGLLTRRYHLFDAIVLNNLPPRIEIQVPRSLISDIPASMQLIIRGSVEDEDGIKRVVLNYRIRNQKMKILLKRYSTVIPYDTFSMIFNLDEFQLLPGEELRFKIMAQDIYGLYAESEEYIVRFPTLNEIYSELTEEVATGMKTVQESRSKFDDFQERLEGYIDSLKFKADLDEEAQKKLKNSLEEIITKLQNSQKSLENFQEVISRMRELSISPDIIKNIEKISKLLNVIMNEELKDLFNNLQKISKIEDEEKLKDIADRIAKNRKKIIENLEFFEKLLERVKEEMEMERIFTQLDDLYTKRKDIRLQTQTGLDMDTLFQEEQKFKKGLDSLNHSIQEKLKNYEDIKSVEKILNELKTSMDKVFSSQDKILSSVKKKRRKRAVQFQKEQESELGRILKQFKNLRNAMDAARSSELMHLLDKIRRELLFISLNLENNLKNESIFPYFHDALLKARDDLKEFSFMFLIGGTGLLKILDFAIDSLNSTPDKSLQSINLVILNLYRIYSAMQNQSKGQGMQDAMKILENLLKRQASLTRRTSGLLPLPFTYPVQSELEKLLEEQKALKSQLMEMYMKSSNEELRQKIYEALKEIDKAQQKLAEHKLTEDIIEHQRRALKHMLEAERALKEQRFSEKRYAEPPKPYIVPHPSELQYKTEIQEINRALQQIDKLDPAYQKIIRKYLLQLLED